MERQLDERFQQDFYTHDDTTQPAAKLLVPLLTSILTRPVARGGFGVAPAGIPPQGASTDGDYLQVLIGKSKVPRGSFATAFACRSTAVPARRRACCS